MGYCDGGEKGKSCSLATSLWCYLTLGTVRTFLFKSNLSLLLQSAKLRYVSHCSQSITCNTHTKMRNSRSSSVGHFKANMYRTFVTQGTVRFG